MPAYELNYAANTPSFKKDDPRIGTLIHRCASDPLKWKSDSCFLDSNLILLGFPHDEGVKRNGGRLGARNGPKIVRQFLPAMGTVWNPELGMGLEISDGATKTVTDEPMVTESPEFDTVSKNQVVEPRVQTAGIEMSSVDAKVTRSFFQIGDGGDVDPDQPLESAHRELEERVHMVLTSHYDEESGNAKAKHCIVVGGGDDQSYCNSMGFLRAVEKEQSVENTPLQPVVINIDAHLDCRTLDDEGRVHSGCPFRLLQESELWGSWSSTIDNTPKFHVFACQGNACAQEHVDYVREKGGSLIWLRDIRGVLPAWYRSKQAKTQTDICLPIRTQAGTRLQTLLDSYPRHARFYISFDIDSICAAFCPGVSAPSVVGGLSAEEALEICLITGLDSRVKILGVAEFNPEFDVGGVTARLVGSMIYHHTLGVANRDKVLITPIGEAKL